MKRRITIAADGVTVADVELVSDAETTGFLIPGGTRVGPGWQWNGNSGAPIFTPGAHAAPLPFGGKGDKGDPGDTGTGKLKLVKCTDFAADPSSAIGARVMIPILAAPAPNTLTQAVPATIAYSSDPAERMYAIAEQTGLRIAFMPKE
jgi:hypothetical protein